MYGAARDGPRTRRRGSSRGARSTSGTARQGCRARAPCRERSPRRTAGGRPRLGGQERDVVLAEHAGAHEAQQVAELLAVTQRFARAIVARLSPPPSGTTWSRSSSSMREMSERNVPTFAPGSAGPVDDPARSTTPGAAFRGPRRGGARLGPSPRGRRRRPPEAPAATAPGRLRRPADRDALDGCPSRRGRGARRAPPAEHRRRGPIAEPKDPPASGGPCASRLRPASEERRAPR